MHRRYSPAAARRACAWLRLAPLAAVALGGCTRAGEGLAPRSFDRPWVPATSASGEILPVPTGKAAAVLPGGYVLPENPALATLPAAPETDPQHVYTLAELLDLAHTANPGLRVAWYEARSAALVPGIIRASHGPRIAATGVGGGVVSSSYLGKGANGEDRDSSGGTAVAAISLEWLLFDFGGREAQIAAARQQALVADIAFTAEHQQVTHQVALAYYDDVAARARSANADRAVELAAQVQASAEARFRRGVGTTMEAAQTRQAAAQLRLAAVQARAAATDARLRLITAIGLPPFTKLRIADAADRTLSPAMAELAEDAVAKALSRRPDMLAALASRKASEESVLAARADFKPKIFASGTASHIRGNRDLTTLPGAGGESATLNVFGRRTSGSVLVGLRVPLYDGGLRAARLEQARDRVEGASAKLEATRNRAVLEIVTAENGLRAALEANAAAEESRSAARTSFAAAFAAYGSGVGAVAEVSLAQQQLLAAENAVSDARASALRAAATLALATGTLGAAPE